MALWGKTDELASVPKWLETAVNNTNTSNDADNCVFIEVAEAANTANRAIGLKTPGWSLYSNAGGRHRSEILVAMKLSTGDGGGGGDGDGDGGGGGGGGTPTTVTFAKDMDYSEWNFTGGGTPQIEIVGTSPGDLYTLLNSGTLDIGTVVTVLSGAAGTGRNVTTTSAFVYSSMGAGGQGAWQAYFTVNAGSVAPTGGANSVSVTYYTN